MARKPVEPLNMLSKQEGKVLVRGYRYFDLASLLVCLRNEIKSSATDDQIHKKTTKKPEFPEGLMSKGVPRA
jgi:hypothetical protein